MSVCACLHTICWNSCGWFPFSVDEGRLGLLCEHGAQVQCSSVDVIRCPLLAGLWTAAIQAATTVGGSFRPQVTAFSSTGLEYLESPKARAVDARVDQALMLARPPLKSAFSDSKAAGDSSQLESRLKTRSTLPLGALTTQTHTQHTHTPDYLQCVLRNTLPSLDPFQAYLMQHHF